MIIGISGKMGAGKNLTASIIQYLVGIKKYNKERLNLGQPSLEQVISSKVEYLNEFSGWKQVAFAGKLKQIASILTGIPVSKFEEKEFKKTFLGSEWNRAIKLTSAENVNLQKVEKLTVRQLLQRLGTDAIRNVIHPDALVNALFADYREPIIASMSDNQLEKLRKEGKLFNYPNWIITDVRFPNELQAVKDRGGITIRVNKPGLVESNHPSETSLYNATFDYVIDNNSDIESLTEKVKTILEKENII